MWIVIRVKTVQYHSKLKPHPGKYGFDFIQGFAAAIQAGITKEELDRTVAIHPSSAEEFVLMR